MISDLELVDVIDEDGALISWMLKTTAHQHGALHKVVIGQLVTTKNEYALVIPKKERQDAGQYVCPVGGHVSKGETEEEALKREISEEIGIDTYSAERIGQGIFNRFVIGRQENHLFVIYKIVSDQIPTLGDEADSVVWFTSDSLKKELQTHPEKFGESFHFVLHQVTSQLFL